MDKISLLTTHERLVVAATLMRLLQRLDSTPAQTATPDQYRGVVDRLLPFLRALHGEPGLDLLLRRYPAAAEMYENLHYANAGLCRSPLDLALQAELQARAAIERAQQGSDKRSFQRGISNGQT